MSGRHRTPTRPPSWGPAARNFGHPSDVPPRRWAVQTAALRDHVRSRGWAGLEISEEEFSAGRHSYGAGDRHRGRHVRRPPGGRRRVRADEGAVGSRRPPSVDFGLPGGGLGDISATAAAVAAHVDGVRSATGAAKVDLIAHSRAGSSSAPTSETSAAPPRSTAIHAGGPEQRHGDRQPLLLLLGRRAGMPAADGHRVGVPRPAQRRRRERGQRRVRAT